MTWLTAGLSDACAAGGQSVWKSLRSGYGETERSQAQRLKAVVAKHGIKVTPAVPDLIQAHWYSMRCQHSPHSAVLYSEILQS